MIDEGVHQWLKDLTPERSAILVQVTRIPEERIRDINTVGERIRVMRKYISDRLTEVCDDCNMSPDSFEVVGPSDAIIRTTPEKLRQLVAEDRPLAKAQDLIVRPNALMSGVSSA